MGTLKKLFSRSKGRKGRKKYLKVIVDRPCAGETVYYFKLNSYDGQKEARIDSDLTMYRSLGLCTGHDLSRLPWEEVRVFYNPVYQKDRERTTESMVVKNIQELFS